MIFGERLPRKLSREGVTVLGMRYHSDALARWMTSKEERDVEVRWHPDNIGQVTVYVGGQKLQVGAVHPGFEGVTAREWLAARRELRGADPQRKIHDRQIVLQAVDAIRKRSTAATTLAGLIAEDWSPARIKQEEDRLFIGFDMTANRQMPRAASDGLGQVIPDQDCDDETAMAIGSRPAPTRTTVPPAANPVVTTPDTPGNTPRSKPWKFSE